MYIGFMYVQRTIIIIIIYYYYYIRIIKES